MTQTSMPIPSLPSGYDVTKHVDARRSDCHLTVGFDREQKRIPRFLVLLHYQTGMNPVRWDEIARMDHNETAALGHDVYQEGLHVDVSHRNGDTHHIDISHAPLPPSQGVVIRRCVEYFIEHAGYFIDVYEGDLSPGNPPRWPDGGESPRTLITSNPLHTDMSREQPAEKILSVDELTEELADATGETVEDIERGAENLEIAPPSEATVVDD